MCIYKYSCIHLQIHTHTRTRTHAHIHATPPTPRSVEFESRGYPTYFTNFLVFTATTPPMSKDQQVTRVVSMPPPPPPLFTPDHLLFTVMTAPFRATSLATLSLHAYSAQFFLSCVCVCRCRGCCSLLVCVCDLLIFSHPRTSSYSVASSFCGIYIYIYMYI